MYLRRELKGRFEAVEVLLRRNVFQQHSDRMDSLIGWHYAVLEGSITIHAVRSFVFYA